jgi:hypothetical protein
MSLVSSISLSLSSNTLLVSSSAELLVLSSIGRKFPLCYNQVIDGRRGLKKAADDW